MQTLFDMHYIAGTQALQLVAIYAAAAVFSGWSGFGFSAIGALSLVILPPKLGVPLLMLLSLAAQALSFGSLAHELRPHAGARGWRHGALPYILGGVLGLPVGLAILALLGERPLLTGLGVLLLAYAAWSLYKPACAVLAAPLPSLRSAMLVGAAGGVVGGFAAFPGSALVVWNGVVGRTSEQSRALTQPYIVFMQTVALVLLVVLRPQTFDTTFWAVLAMALPGTLLGNQLGVALYRRTGDGGHRRLTLTVLGLAGAGLLLKVALA